MSNRNCTQCNSQGPFKVQTYKHTWFFCDVCGSADIYPRTWYPLGFTGIPALSRDKAISKTPGAMYDYFDTKVYAEMQVSRAEEFMGYPGVSEHVCMEGKSVLDISAGSGIFSNHLNKYGAKKIAITEFNRKAVDYAKRELDLEARVFDINKDKLRGILPDDYDVVLLRGCIEFCTDLKSFIDNLRDILQPGSIVLYTMIIPTLGAALRTQFDQYNVLRLRQPSVMSEEHQRKGFECIYNEDIFLHNRVYPYEHLRNKKSLFYLYYLAPALYRLRKAQNYPFHTLDCRCQMMIFEYKGV